MIPAPEEMELFQKEVYQLVSQYLKENAPYTLFMCCGVMLKTCIEMYCSVLEENKVEEVLQEAINSIPSLHEKTKKELKTTFH